MNSTISKLVPGPGEGILANLSTFALKNGFFFKGGTGKRQIGANGEFTDA